MLNIEGLNHYYRQAHTLRDVSIHLPEGKIVALLGRNGVGKSTLLKCVMGLQPVHDGTMHFREHSLGGIPAFRRAGLGIGYVPQGRMIFPALTVEENLKSGLGILPRGARQLPSLIFDLFPVLYDMLSRQGGNLSGGQQQQLAIARALVFDPTLLILDEPTEGIQPNVVSEIGAALKLLNQEKALTIWIVEQKLPLIRWIADQFHILNRGRVVHAGNIEALDESTTADYLTV